MSDVIDENGGPVEIQLAYYRYGAVVLRECDDIEEARSAAEFLDESGDGAPHAILVGGKVRLIRRGSSGEWVSPTPEQQGFGA